MYKETQVVNIHIYCFSVLFRVFAQFPPFFYRAHCIDLAVSGVQRFPPTPTAGTRHVLVAARNNNGLVPSRVLTTHFSTFVSMNAFFVISLIIVMTPWESTLNYQQWLYYHNKVGSRLFIVGRGGCSTRVGRIACP